MNAAVIPFPILRMKEVILIGIAAEEEGPFTVLHRCCGEEQQIEGGLNLTPAVALAISVAKEIGVPLDPSLPRFLENCGRWGLPALRLLDAFKAGRAA